MTPKQILFVDSKTGYLYVDTLLTQLILCKEHQSPIRKDFRCKRGMHEVHYFEEGSYLLFEVYSSEV